MPDLATMLDDLALLVDTESPSGELDLLERSASTLAGLIGRRLGSAAEIVAAANGPHVHWTGGGTPAVLIVGHHDTVFPTGTVAARPFAVADGRATGPGVFDMKGGIVQALHGIAELHDRQGIELLITADEEIGSRTSRLLIEQRARACGAVLVLEPAADGGALKVGRKGTGTFEVIVRGRAAHAGLEPHKGVNALVAAAELVLAAAGLGRPELGTTVTPTVARAGTTDNVVPAEARVLIDVRVAAAGEDQRLAAAMAGLATTVPGATVEVRGGLNRPPMPESAAATLFPIAQAVAAAQGLGEIAGVTVGGGSDGNFTAAAGVPTLDGLGALGGGAHADHEWIEVAAMIPRARLLAGLVAHLQHR